MNTLLNGLEIISVAMVFIGIAMIVWNALNYIKAIKKEKEEAVQAAYDEVVHVFEDGTLQCDKITKIYNQKYTAYQLFFSQEINKQYQRDCLIMLLKQNAKKKNNK